MKALIGFLSLALGGLVVATIVKIQTDPFAFTSHVPVITEEPARTAEEPARITATPAPIRHTHRITLAEVEIIGHVPRRVHKVRAPRLAKAAVVKVEAPPCVDGQYRKLEAHRGVHLMCPH